MKIPIQGISQQDGYSWDDDDTEVENLEITENLSLREKETDFSLSRKLSRSGKRERHSFLKRLRLRFSNFLISKKFTRRKIIIMSTTLSLEIILVIILGRSLSRVGRALKVSLRALKFSLDTIENALPLIPLLSYNRTVQLVNYLWSEIIFKALNKEFIRIHKHLSIQNYFMNLASLDCILAHNKILRKELKNMYLVADTRQSIIWSSIPGLLSYEASSLLMLKRKDRLKDVFVNEIACYALREMLALYPASKTPKAVALLKYVSTKIDPLISK